MEYREDPMASLCSLERVVRHRAYRAGGAEDGRPTGGGMTGAAAGKG